MQPLFLQSLFSEETLRAICWTLIHSVWQGLLAAAMAGIIIISTRKSPARLRYNLLGLVLTLFVVAGIVTFFQQLNSGYKKDRPVIEITAFEKESFITENHEAPAAPAANAVDDLVAFFNGNAGLFVLLWFAFFLLHCIKLLTGLAGINRLRAYKVHIPVKDWQVKLNELGKKLNIQQSTRLLESELVKVPVAIGFLKPVILVPLGLLSNLPTAQVETILLHELAHIVRKDYVMNVLQRFAEAVYFFNPSLLWISSLIRQEREACCDDIVIANTHHKGSYLEALVSFQEYSLSNSGYAMAISSKKHYLLNRVKRMLTRENKKLNVMEKIFLVAGLLIVTAFTLIPKNETVNKKNIAAIEQEKKLPVPKQSAAISLPGIKSSDKPVAKKGNKQAVYEAPVNAVAMDTVPSPKEKTGDLKFPSISSNINDDGKTKTETTTVTDQDGKKYTYTKLNNKVTSLSIDGKAIPENEINNYSSLFDQIEIAMDENKARRLNDMKRRKLEMAKRVEEYRNMAGENKARRLNEAERRKLDMAKRELLQEYQKKQRQYLNEQNRQTERSRRLFEARQKEMMRLMEKQRRLKMSVPMINGREVIYNDIHTDNTIVTDAHTKTDIHLETSRLLQEGGDLKKQAQNLNGETLYMNSQADLEFQLQLNTNVNINSLKNFDYKPGNEELNLYYQYPSSGNVKPVSPVKKPSAAKPPEKAGPKVNYQTLRKRVTT